MKKISLNLEYCYGIKKLEKGLDFGSRTFAIYAPNGSMKTSLAKTFTDLMNDNETKDLVYPERVTVREIKDENNQDLKPEEIFVVEPYNESYFSKKESTLVVEKELREQYENIYSDIEKEKSSLIRSIKTVSQSSDCEEEILAAFSEKENDSLFDILEKIAPLINSTNTQYSFRYNDVFDKKGNVKKFLDKYSKSLDEYVGQYESLISQSSFFKKSSNTFGTYQAKELLSSVSDNSFFEAGHSINLSDSTPVTSATDFESLMETEIKKILSDDKLKKIFDGIDKAIGSSVELRAFKKVIESDNSLLVKLQDYDQFKKDVWLGHFSKIEIEIKALLDFYNSKKTEVAEIVKKAADTATEWEAAAEEFNSRFTSLPFKIIIKNKEDVILKTSAPVSEFVFTDVDQKNLKREDLLRFLSLGERRALYLLNIIFEIRARKNANQKTLLIIDDIADSFDYKNKYAIVEYLKDISEDDNFFQIILTHNFDFFRTIQGRGVVPYGQCLISSKTDSGINLEKATYINNPFINDWKDNLVDNKKLIASIPFVRNIIEYTKGSGDNDYLLLTSILHLKSNSSTITINDFKVAFESCIKNVIFPVTIDTTKNIGVLIFETADECLTAADGINLEHKIVMSIAIRLKAEQFMKSKIADQVFLSGLDTETNQTRKLFDQYKKEFNNEKEFIEILKKVNLITPENIHVNSFMYEPILDMGDSELRELYQLVKSGLV